MIPPQLQIRNLQSCVQLQKRVSTALQCVGETHGTTRTVRGEVGLRAARGKKPEAGCARWGGVVKTTRVRACMCASELAHGEEQVYISSIHQALSCRGSTPFVGRCTCEDCGLGSLMCVTCQLAKRALGAPPRTLRAAYISSASTRFSPSVSMSSLDGVSGPWRRWPSKRKRTRSRA